MDDEQKTGQHNSAAPRSLLCNTPFSERDLAKIYQLTSDIVCIADIQGLYFKKVNPAFTRILGYTEDHIYRTPIMDFIHPDDRERTLAQIKEELLAGKETINFTNRYQHRNGAYLWLEWRAKPLPEQGLTYAIGRDVTDRRRMEDELLKLQKLESVGILAGGIAHDFNNLLMAIMGNISCSRALIRPGDKTDELLAEAEQACWAAKDLSHRLLTFSRGGEPVPAPVRVETIVRDAASIALAGSTVSLNIDVPADLPLVDIDEGQIRQVISNLLINAREAMSEGGCLEIEARAKALGCHEVAMLPAGYYIQLLIRDNGAGIPAENLLKVFDPYFSTKEMGSHKGRGLGLAICHSIVQKHQGAMTVESSPGKGSTFALYLPVAGSAGTITAGTVNAKAGALKGKILLMDDDERVSSIVREMLRAMKYSVETATDGSRAVELYERAQGAGQPFTLVLLDLTVPGGMGGLEALGKLREMDPAVCAIVTSGYGENSVIKDFRAYGFAGAISKPYTLKQLEQAITQVLGRP